MIGRSIADTEHEKRLAAEAAAQLVEPGTTIGLGTSTTVAHLLPAPADAARQLGLDLGPLEGIDRLDLAFDGAGQARPDGWLIKAAGPTPGRRLWPSRPSC
jgi:ribose 5-phosphate isomerase A